jgi:ubiquinone/menaquinone biosynthesis C-methylase UbiE
MSQDPMENWIQRVADASQLFLQHNGPHSWLLQQSIYTHFQRLVSLLSMSCAAVTGSILDVGAGTGALTLDLAWRVGLNGLVTALDNDAEALKIAQSLAERVGVKIATLLGDATALPVKDATQDMAVSRYLFQHLPDPSAVLFQMRRVTRPGGRIVIIDVDDGVALCEPLVSQHLAALRKAIRTLQLQRGGNRLIGRQLYRLMREVGLGAIQVIVIPRVRLGIQNGRSSAEIEAFQIERLLMEREELINSGLMTAHDFDAAISEMEREFAQDCFEMEADFIATGLVPTV